MPVNITVEFVQKLLEQNTALLEQNAALTKQADELNATVRELTQTIRELKEQLNKNSKNSSKPPLRDGLRKPPVNKDCSLRRKFGRKQGAQTSHDGVNLSVIADPDHVEHHMHSDCGSCSYHDSCPCMAGKRQWISLPTSKVDGQAWMPQVSFRIFMGSSSMTAGDPTGSIRMPCTPYAVPIFSGN